MSAVRSLVEIRDDLANYLSGKSNETGISLDDLHASVAQACASPSPKDWHAAIMEEWHKHPSFDTAAIERRAYELAGASQ